MVATPRRSWTPSRLAAAVSGCVLAVAIGFVGVTSAAPDTSARASLAPAELPTFGVSTTGADPSSPDDSAAVTTLPLPAPVGSEAAPKAPSKRSTQSVPAPELSRAATTTTTAPVLPVPERVPADPYANVETPHLGSISMPAIGLVHDIYEGVTLTAIDKGPGHWPGTAMPGAYGNAVFGGHRTTHSAPFNGVGDLSVGDEIVFDLVDGSRHVYRMTEQFIVEPTAMWIVDQMPGHTVTLFACHPKGSAAQRIVTRGELVSPAPAS